MSAWISKISEFSKWSSIGWESICQHHSPDIAQ
jgi:hypothetical protein